MKKKIMIICLVICFALLGGSICLAGSEDYIPSATPSIGDFTIQSNVRSIIGTLQWIGYAISVGMLVFVGIKYIMASADEKASIKGILVKVLIGSVIIAVATTIVNFVILVSER